jgi:hypothetical protein
MRAAAFTSAAVIAIGAYLMIASTLAFTPTWIALGMLAIAVTVAITLVATDPHSAVSQ